MIVPHGISPRSIFSQTAVGRYVEVNVDGACLSRTLQICIVLYEKTIWFLSVGSLLVALHTVNLLTYSC